MQDASYYSIIERADNGRFLAWIPDLPGITAVGLTEDAVIRELSHIVRQRVRDMILAGKPVPRARAAEDLPQGCTTNRLHRLLLIIG